MHATFCANPYTKSKTIIYASNYRDSAFVFCLYMPPIPYSQQLTPRHVFNDVKTTNNSINSSSCNELPPSRDIIQRNANIQP